MSLAKKFIIINLLWNWAIKRVSVSSMCESLTKNFLLVVRRIVEIEKGKYESRLFNALCSGKEICDFYEYRDLDSTMENWEVYYIKNTHELTMVSMFTVSGYNYEYGDHEICICDGAPHFESGKCFGDEHEYPINVIDSKYYGHDH